MFLSVKSLFSIFLAYMIKKIKNWHEWKEKNHSFFVQVLLHFLIFICLHNLDSCFPFISLSTNFRKQGQICENMVRVVSYSWKFSWMRLKVLLVISYSVVVSNGQNGQKKRLVRTCLLEIVSQRPFHYHARNDDANLVI